MSVRAVIDTNVLVSSFLSKNPNSPTVRIANALLDGRFTPVHSRGMIDEYVDVLGRDYLNLQAAQVEELIGHLKTSGEEVVPAESNDNFNVPLPVKPFALLTLICAFSPARSVASIVPSRLIVPWVKSDAPILNVVPDAIFNVPVPFMPPANVASPLKLIVPSL